MYSRASWGTPGPRSRTQHGHDPRQALPDRLVWRADPAGGGVRHVIESIDAGQSDQSTAPLAGVQSLRIACCAGGDRGRHVDLDDGCADRVGGGAVGSAWRHQGHDRPVAGIQGGPRQPGRAQDLGGAIRRIEPEVAMRPRAERIAVEDLHADAAAAQMPGERLGQGRLARPWQAGEPDRARPAQTTRFCLMHSAYHFADSLGMRSWVW